MHYVGVVEPLFHFDGRQFMPTEHTRGPWDPRAQHGGPPAALIARAIESLPSESPMAVARLTMEILRPVPLAPLEVSARVERAGRRVELVSATLSSDDQLLCRASAWRMRKLEIPIELRDSPGLEGEAIPPPDHGEPHRPESDEPAFHRTGVQLCFVRGTFAAMGPATAWIRLLRPVVENEEPSPLMRVVAAGDFGNGISAVLDWTNSLFINIDLTVYLDREATGEWICLDARTVIGPDGMGLAESALHDTQGRIGRALQALLVDPVRA